MPEQALKIKESERSEEVRSELRKQGFRIFWDVTEEKTRVSYATDGRGRALLLLEHASTDNDKNLRWESWDIYRPLTRNNKIAETYQALAEYTKDTTAPDLLEAAQEVESVSQGLKLDAPMQAAIDKLYEAIRKAQK